nr:alpha/beta fold hydrolase [Kitasatospora sp. MAA4]
MGTLEIPTLVLWGDSDRIVDPDYGRAYAAAIPPARFQLLTDTGHNAQMETPDQVVHAIWDGADTDFSAFAR